MWDHPPCSSQLRGDWRCHWSQKGGQSFSERWESGLGKDPCIGTPPPPAGQRRAVSLETQWGIAAARVMGVSMMAGQRSGSRGGQFRTPHEPTVALGKDTQYYPRRPPRICRGPVWRAPPLSQTLMPLSPGTPPPTPPNTAWHPGAHLPPAAGSAGLRPPEAPRWSRAARVYAPVRGPRSSRPGSARRGASPGFRGGRGAVAGGRDCSGGGAPGDRAGPASRSPSPRSVAGPAARCSALERRQGRAQPGPPPPRPSPPGPPLSGPCGRPPSPLFRGAEPALPAWAAMRGARRGARPGPACALGRGRLLLPAARGGHGGRLARGAWRGRAAGRRGEAFKPRAGRGLRSPGGKAHRRAADARGTAGQGRAGRRGSRPEHPLPTPAFLLQL